MNNLWIEFLWSIKILTSLNNSKKITYHWSTKKDYIDVVRLILNCCFMQIPLQNQSFVSKVMLSHIKTLCRSGKSSVVFLPLFCKVEHHNCIQRVWTVGSFFCTLLQIVNVANLKHYYIFCSAITLLCEYISVLLIVQLLVCVVKLDLWLAWDLVLFERIICSG